MPLINRLLASPLIPDKYRASLYRLFGLNVGSGTWVCSDLVITQNLDNIQIGKYSYINDHCYFENRESILIEDNVSIAPFVKILTTTHDPNNGSENRRVQGMVCKPVVIQSGCWIGCGVTILPGVKIGRGCIIGAGAVVIRDCLPNGMYAGNPAVRKKDLPIKRIC